MRPLGVPKSPFSTVKQRKIPDIVYKQLVSLITSGHFKPGEKLPSERDMALELGVSRQSIREAIYRAKIEGLIEVKQGGGTFVISSIKETLRPPLSILLEEQVENIFKFLEIRKVIEGWCAEKASTTAKPADIKEMQAILSKMENAKLSDQRWEKADLSFHSAIAAATHNLIAMHVMEGLKDSFSEYFRVKKFRTKPERKDLLLKQHKALFKAIKERDPRKAREKMLEHLDYVDTIINTDLLGKG
jgi:GntR family transcriptional regulator, transcriptional repressor for pyruvate dehydrogenase complex